MNSRYRKKALVAIRETSEETTTTINICKKGSDEETAIEYRYGIAMFLRNLGLDDWTRGFIGYEICDDSPIRTDTPYCE